MRSTSARLRRNLESIHREVREGDVVIVHDPQPAGLIGPLAELGAHVVWRCHVGYDGVERVDRACLGFHAPLCGGGERACVLARVVRAGMDRPCVAAGDTALDRSVHRQEPGARAALEVLALLGAAEARLPPIGAPAGRRECVDRADVVRERPSAAIPRVPLVVQVSRWDRMKDMAGVLEGVRTARAVRRPRTSCWPGPQ